VRFVTDESPMHVSVLANIDDPKRAQLVAAYENAFRALVGADGNVTYDAPYAVVTAVRR
jgi:hypothetical protein